MSTTHATGTTAPDPTKSLFLFQAVITVWTITGLVAFGVAWTLGLDTDWWQRILFALPVAGLAYLDIRGFDAVIEVRAGLTRALSDLGWAQIPLAVAGGAWLLGLTAALGQRLVIGAVIALVAALYHYAPHAAAPAGGTR